MRIIINIVLLLLIVFFGFLLYSNIQEPIKFQAEKNKRKDSVVAKLVQIREAQEMHRSITGKFSNDFDSLSHVLRTDSIIRNEKIVVDQEDPENKELWVTETVKIPAIDSVRTLGFNLDSLRYVPYTDGLKFSIQADTMTYQKTLVSVVEVGTRWKDFMGEYANPKYKKYDDSYEPMAMLKFGDMNKPSIGGSWAR